MGGGSTNISGGEKLAWTGRNWSGGADKRPATRDSTSSKSSGASNFRPQPSLACLICSGPHRVAECPHQGALSALQMGTQELTTSQRVSERVEEEMDEEPAQVGSIRFLSALRSQLDQIKKKPTQGLTYVDVVINGRATKAMVDTGATDTFITPAEAKKCGLVVNQESGQMKVVNSPASAICGSSKKVMTKLGPWEGGIDFTVSPMDDFDVVIDLDFLTLAKAILMSAASCLMFLGTN